LGFGCITGYTDKAGRSHPQRKTPTETPKPDHEVLLLLNFFDELRRRVPVK
jgi:hypothetical protein